VINGKDSLLLEIFVFPTKLGVHKLRGITLFNDVMHINLTQLKLIEIIDHPEKTL